MRNPDLLRAVAVTAELCGRTFTEAAARAFVDDLARYPLAQVLGALKRCRAEVRGVLTLADVIARIDDGRPGPDEAWARCPKSEDDAVVWTSEIAEAWGIAAPLLAARETTAARFAFRDAYTRRVAIAREAGTPVEWVPSMGFDPHAREAALREAVADGRLRLADAVRYVPALEAPPSVPLLAESQP